MDKLNTWGRLSGGGILVVSGLVVAIIGNSGGNLGIVTLGLPILGGGGYLLWSGWRKLRNRERVIKPGTKDIPGVGTPVANCMVLSPGRLEYEYIADPPGIEHLHRDDGKWYHWLERSGPGEPVTVLPLPDIGDDNLHYSPREFANVVSMPANKVLFTALPSMLQKLSLIGMVVIIGILAILIVIFLGETGGAV